MSIGRKNHQLPIVHRLAERQRSKVPVASVQRAAALVVATLLGSFVLVPAPGSAEPEVSPGDDRPTISEVKSEIDQLNHEAEIASEEFNTVRVQMQDAQERLGTLKADVTSQRNRVEAIRSQIVGTALSDYQSNAGLSTSTSFLVADNPQAFVSGLANSAVLQEQQADLLTQLTEQQQQLVVRDEQAQLELDAVADDKQRLVDHQREIDAKSKQAEQLLAGLERKQRERLEALQAAAVHTDPGPSTPDSPATPSVTDTAATPSVTDSPAVTTPDVTRDQPRPSTTSSPGSDRAQTAVDTALAQVGDPYVYGAAGPSSFDCSGLTMYAWAAAGVSIPHASSMQTGVGTPVSVSSLSPGDLVFYYSPISHVGMYIGNGQLVHAPHPGSSVEVVPLNSMPIATAVHIG